MTELPEEIFELVRRFEGCRLTAYRDSGGVLSIGVGHTGPDVTEGMTITTDEAERLFRQDMESAARSVLQMVTVPLSPTQLGALASWTFNLGAGTFRKSTLRKRLNEGRFDLAAEEMTKWVYCNGRVLPGLVARRAAEAALFTRLPWQAGA